MVTRVPGLSSRREKLCEQQAAEEGLFSRFSRRVTVSVAKLLPRQRGPGPRLRPRASGLGSDVLFFSGA